MKRDPVEQLCDKIKRDFQLTNSLDHEFYHLQTSCMIPIPKHEFDKDPIPSMIRALRQMHTLQQDVISLNINTITNHSFNFRKEAEDQMH